MHSTWADVESADLGMDFVQAENNDAASQLAAKKLPQTLQLQ